MGNLETASVRVNTKEMTKTNSPVTGKVKNKIVKWAQDRTLKHISVLFTYS